ncbi:MAG: proton-conducting transporter membrane subunit [Cyclobacteriaceae bacterium]
MLVPILITTLALPMLTVVSGKVKGMIALAVVLMNAGVSSWFAFRALSGASYEMVMAGGMVFGEIPLRVDALSAWFILVMNLTMVTGILYGIRYMTPHLHQSANMSLHYSSYILNHLAMLAIYSVQNSLFFLCAWELMAITCFLLIIFEHEKMETLKAGINYLVQSHLCIVFLTVGFIWVSSNTGSYDFKAISLYTASVISPLSFLLFGCFFVGFAFKAGFVPFHTWLPYAHPAAPAHVSGIMSAVIIKLGIFGILRMLLLIRENHLMIGYAILILSFITGVYGVMLAIIQHDLKKLLAYHSIENIGIIGMGIGLGAIGLGSSQPALAFAGFAGALLHTLNHSLFKSLLFYCAGTVYRATHTLNLEKLGGLIKKMPQSAALFLIGSLAICGLPPFNGFISEFLIYSGLFSNLGSHPLVHTALMVTAIFSLVIIGGLAILCFTKAFSIVFLGVGRHQFNNAFRKGDLSWHLPKYIIAGVIIAIGLLPRVFVELLTNPISLFEQAAVLDPEHKTIADALPMVSLAAWSLIILTLIVLIIRKLVTASRPMTVEPTWACGYSAGSPQLQYTANSFVRSYRKLIRPVLMMNKKEEVVEGVFPKPIHIQTHPYDKIESLLVDLPTRYIRGFMGRFRILQNGSVQFYILYGIVFIIISIAIPQVVSAVSYVVDLFGQI